MLMPQAFLVAVGSSILSTNPILRCIARPSMSKSLARPSPTASFASSAASSTAATSQGDAEDDERNAKPRILCLHGKFQSGSILSNKIAGARRKLSREYELDFLDGPILLPQEEEGEDGDAIVGYDDPALAPRAWWLRSEEDGKHTLVREAFEYVIGHDAKATKKYDGIIGFSQGGTLAAALALSGALPNVRVVVTAGAPHVREAFDLASELSGPSNDDGFEVPKLHLAGERDAMVSVDSTRELCQRGGNGKLIVHEQGHLFPTRSARVKEMLDFLGAALSET